MRYPKEYVQTVVLLMTFAVLHLAFRNMKQERVFFEGFYYLAISALTFRGVVVWFRNMHW